MKINEAELISSLFQDIEKSNLNEVTKKHINHYLLKEFDKANSEISDEKLESIELMERSTIYETEIDRWVQILFVQEDYNEDVVIQAYEKVWEAIQDYKRYKFNEDFDEFKTYGYSRTEGYIFNEET